MTTTEQAAQQLGYRESNAIHATDAFYISWLGKQEGVKEFRAAVVDLCRANDLAAIVLDRDFAHDDFVAPEPIMEMDKPVWSRMQKVGGLLTLTAIMGVLLGLVMGAI